MKGMNLPNKEPALPENMSRELIVLTNIERVSRNTGRLNLVAYVIGLDKWITIFSENMALKDIEQRRFCGKFFSFVHVSVS